MNNHTLKYFSIIAVFLSITSCINEQKDLFPESAAARLNNTIDLIDSTLIVAPNGWVMHYFATKESSGYTLLLKFSESGEVIVAANNALVKNKYSEAGSMYNVIADNGPVLTFNTFNNVLHVFSNPENPSGTGLEGDYEFVVYNVTDTLITLKGKKRGTEIELIRLKENISWSDYLNSLVEMDNQLFGSDPLYFIAASDTFLALNGTNHIFEFKNTNSSKNFTMPFIVTPQGIKFYESYYINEKQSVRNFILSSDGFSLLSDSYDKTFFMGSKVASYFSTMQATYKIDTSLMSNHFKEPIAILAKQMKEKYNGKRNLDFLAFSYKTGFGHSLMISTSPTVTVANYKIDFELDNPNENILSIQKIDNVFDANGEIFYSTIDGMNNVWSMFEGLYKLESTLSKNVIKFIDIDNNDRYFILKKN